MFAVNSTFDTQLPPPLATPDIYVKQAISCLVEHLMVLQKNDSVENILRQFFLFYILPEIILLNNLKEIIDVGRYTAPTIVCPLSKKIKDDATLPEIESLALSLPLSKQRIITEDEINKIIKTTMITALSKIGNELELSLLSPEYQISDKKFTLIGFALYQALCSNIFSFSVERQKSASGQDEENEDCDKLDTWNFYVVDENLESNSLKIQLTIMGQIASIAFRVQPTSNDHIDIQHSLFIVAELLAYQGQSLKIECIFPPKDEASLKIETCVKRARELFQKTKCLKELGELSVLNSQTIISEMHYLLITSTPLAKDASHYNEPIKTKIDRREILRKLTCDKDAFFRKSQLLATLQEENPEEFARIVHKSTGLPCTQQCATPKEMRIARQTPDGAGIGWFTYAIVEILQSYMDILLLVEEVDTSPISSFTTIIAKQGCQYAREDYNLRQKHKSEWTLQFSPFINNTEKILVENKHWFDKNRTTKQNKIRNITEYRLCQFTEEEELLGIPTESIACASYYPTIMKECVDVLCLNAIRAGTREPDAPLPFAFELRFLSKYINTRIPSREAGRYKVSYNDYMNYKSHSCELCATVKPGEKTKCQNYQFFISSILTYVRLCLMAIKTLIGKNKRKYLVDTWESFLNALYD